MYVLSVKDINKQKGEVEAIVYLRQQQNDFQLMFNMESDGGCFLDNKRISFNTDMNNSIWMPYIVLSNLADEEVKMASSLWIYPNCNDIYTEFLLLKALC